jgi:hypothetical protein
MSKIEICILQGPPEPLIDDTKNRVRHGLALRILGDYIEENVVSQGRGRKKKKILLARITNKFWKTHQVALSAAGFRNIWPDEDTDSSERLVRLAQVAKKVENKLS